MRAIAPRLSHNPFVSTRSADSSPEKMSRRPSDQNRHRQQPLINGNQAWTLESILAPPGERTTSASGAAQRLSQATSQGVEQILDAIPLLRDPSVRFSAASSDMRSRITTLT